MPRLIRRGVLRAIVRGIRRGVAGVIGGAGGFSVQHFDDIAIAGLTQVDVTIEEVDTTDSFVLWNNKGASTGSNSTFEAYFINSTTVRIQRATSSAVEIMLNLQVVTGFAGFSVQHITTDLPSASATVAIDTIDVGSTFITVDAHKYAGASSNRNAFVHASITNDALVTFSKSDNDVSQRCYGQVVSCENATVQTVSASCVATPINSVLSTPVDKSKTFVISSTKIHTGSIDNNFKTGWASTTLSTDGTTLTTERTDQSRITAVTTFIVTSN